MDTCVKDALDGPAAPLMTPVAEYEEANFKSTSMFTIARPVFRVDDSVRSTLQKFLLKYTATMGKSEKHSEMLPGLTLASRTVHADGHIASHRAIAPAMHVSTTFRYSENPDELSGVGIGEFENLDVSLHCRGDYTRVLKRD